MSGLYKRIAKTIAKGGASDKRSFYFIHDREDEEEIPRAIIERENVALDEDEGIIVVYVPLACSGECKFDCYAILTSDRLIYYQNEELFGNSEHDMLNLADVSIAKYEEDSSSPFYLKVVITRYSGEQNAFELFDEKGAKELCREINIMAKIWKGSDAETGRTEDVGETKSSKRELFARWLDEEEVGDDLEKAEAGSEPWMMYRSVTASGIYDACIRQGTKNRAVELAGKYRENENCRTISQKVSALRMACNEERESTDDKKLKGKIVLAQAIALLCHRTLDDESVEKAIIDIVIRRVTKTDKLGTAVNVGGAAVAVVAGAAFGVLGKVLKYGVKDVLNGASPVVKENVEIDKAGVGAAATELFIKGAHATIPPAELYGLQGDEAAVEYCLRCSKELQQQVMELTSKMYYAHQLGTDETKISSALQSYVQLEENENIVMTYDPTRLGDADEGVALTTQRVFFCKGDKTKVVRYPEIKDVKSNPEKEEIVIKRWHGGKITLTGLGSSERTEKLREAILFLRGPEVEKPEDAGLLGGLKRMFGFGKKG